MPFLTKYSKFALHKCYSYSTVHVCSCPSFTCPPVLCESQQPTQDCVVYSLFHKPLVYVSIIDYKYVLLDTHVFHMYICSLSSQAFSTFFSLHPSDIFMSLQKAARCPPRIQVFWLQYLEMVIKNSYFSTKILVVFVTLIGRNNLQ